MDQSAQQPLDFDVVIIGAGISGIGFAYRLQERLGLDLRYCILEGRHEIGGTWSLFQYPGKCSLSLCQKATLFGRRHEISRLTKPGSGIRSDSDLHSFGFPWRPWDREEAIADGSLIAQYLKESAAEENIESKILYRHRVEQISWSAASKTWSIEVDAGGTGSTTVRKVIRARFVLLGTGYYDYEDPLQAEIPGIEYFRGVTVHPQF